ncbi:hypothetical protein [Colwellia psychrerythraea]|uniref:Uncharacterized protein n=1 Tax=Colwellia psychrerythraea (strain 34H / ATCC BAA-681) TaxID=167879 RepID=Q48AF5_COLP3|nr:hypothetical protein [Colwellia psychrerythraea]AAZ24285.1 hypothetical protein CPS_0190 [Colwellia psychrerythraea 34H]
MDEREGFFSLPKKNTFEILLTVGFFIGVVVCIFIISSDDLTSRESSIVSLFLTFLSIIASWLLANIYGDSQHIKAIEEVKEMHNEKVKTFALKAAEKVNNLSLNINKLSIYLESELDAEYDLDTESLIGKEKIIESAIHSLTMLKSVNDTSLSDWHGIIDEEIEERREAQEEKEERLNQLTYRLESLTLKKDEDNKDDRLEQQIETMKKDMRLLMAGVSGAHISVGKRKRREEIIKECPSCENKLKFSQRSMKNSIKTIHCSSCDSLISSSFVPAKDDFLLTLKVKQKKETHCSDCGEKISFELDTEVKSRSVVNCGKCHKQVTAIRLENGEVKYTEGNEYMSSTLTENDIENVSKALPLQPWPQGIHKKVATELNMSNSAVRRSMKILISRGIVKNQVDGQLFDNVVQVKN